MAMCTIDGRRLRQKVGDRRATCDRWPDRDGLVRRWLLTWAGVPKPERWWLRVRGLLRRELPGCGCIEPLRRLWEAITRRPEGESPPARSSGPG